MRNKIAILVIFTFVLLVACNQNPVPVDPTTFELVPDLIINPELDGLVMLQVEDADFSVLIATTNNQTEDNVYLDHPTLEYFDGNDWRTVLTFEGYALLNFEDEEVWVPPGAKQTFNLPLDEYQHPKYGLFRVRRRIYLRIDDGWDRSSFHDLVAEFTLE